MSKTKNTVVCYTNVKPINKKYLVKMSLETGHTMSDCMDALLTSIRTGKSLKLKPKKPKYVERAERVKTKKQKQLDALTAKAKKELKKSAEAAPKTRVKRTKSTRKSKPVEAQATA